MSLDDSDKPVEHLIRRLLPNLQVHKGVPDYSFTVLARVPHACIICEIQFLI